MVGMDWDRLGAMVRQRRASLGYTTRKQFTEATGFPPKTLYDLEKHVRENFDVTTFARLEVALKWVPGSVDKVLAGGSPLTGDEVPVAVPTDDMDPLAAEVVYLLGPDSPLGEEDKDDMRDLFGHLIKRYRTIARIEQREAGGG